MANYILDGHKVIKEPDIIKWGKWFETANRRVRHDTANVTLNGDNVGIISISTVFLGIDNGLGRGQPLLFETMVFGGKLNQEMDRCSTWEEAEKMHELMCEKAKLTAK